jgi:hypothetical protein
VDEMSVSMPQGTSSETLGHVDLLSRAELRRLAAAGGPCVSLFLPTARFGPETLSGPSRLRGLLSDATTQLADRGVSAKEAEGMLAPARELVDDEPFWQRLSDGLALYCAHGVSARFRVPVAFTEEVAVGEAFRIRPLLPVSAADGLFHILALAQKSVRVLAGTRLTVGEVSVPGLPGSMAEAIPQEEMQRYGQSHSVGSTGTKFHGQGNEADYDKVALERYFRAVDGPLVARLGSSNGDVPLVLACVGYYAPIYRQVSRYPAVWPKAVEGNPEELTPARLHDAAWPLVEEHFADRGREWLERYHHQMGTGRTATGSAEVLAAARDGRVDTMLLDAAAEDGSALDEAVAAAVRHDGRVVSLPGTDLGAEPAALLRW